MLWSARCPAWRASDKWRTGVASITIPMQSSAGGQPRVDAAALAVQGGRRWLWAAWEASANRWRILRRLAMDVFSSSGMPCGAVPCDTVRCESSWFLGSRRAAQTSDPVGDGSVGCGGDWRRIFNDCESKLVGLGPGGHAPGQPIGRRRRPPRSGIGWSRLGAVRSTSNASTTRLDAIGLVKEAPCSSFVSLPLGWPSRIRTASNPKSGARSSPRNRKKNGHGRLAGADQGVARAIAIMPFARPTTTWRPSRLVKLVSAAIPGTQHSDAVAPTVCLAAPSGVTPPARPRGVQRVAQALVGPQDVATTSAGRKA